MVLNMNNTILNTENVEKEWCTDWTQICHQILLIFKIPSNGDFFHFFIQCARRICNNENISTQMVLNMNNTIVKRMLRKSGARIEHRFVIKFINFYNTFKWRFFSLFYSIARRICNNENISTQMILNMNNTILKRMLRKSGARIEHRFVIKFY